MFEFLMLIGFLGAGFSHWRPVTRGTKRPRGEGGEEKATHGRKKDGKEGEGSWSLDSAMRRLETCR